jgi:hypothetical protein
MNLLNYFHEPAPVREEAGRLLDQKPPEALAGLARHVRAQAAIDDEKVADVDAEADVERAVAGGHEPKVYVDWGATLLVDLARRRTAAPAEQRRRLERARAFATTRDGREFVDGALRSLEIAGRPLALDFVDALTGTSAAPIGAAGRPLLLHVAAVTGETAAQAEQSTRCEGSPRSARTS